MSPLIHLCPECKQVIYLQDPYEGNPDEFANKYTEHLLWHHPTDDAVSEAVWDLGIIAQEIFMAFIQEDYIKASMSASELSTLALRVKHYVDGRN